MYRGRYVTSPSRERFFGYSTKRSFDFTGYFAKK